MVQVHPTVPLQLKSLTLQHLVDKPNVFAPQKIQKALQMALRMVTLSRRNGQWFARKGIPKDVRDEYARLYGVRREAHLKLPGDTPPAEAKIRNAEWTAEIETRIATIRAQRNGDGQPLTKVNAIALAGRWYRWFIKQHAVGDAIAASHRGTACHQHPQHVITALACVAQAGEPMPLPGQRLGSTIYRFVRFR